MVGRLLQNEPDISYPLQSHKKPILVIFGSILSMGSLSMTQKRVHTSHVRFDPGFGHSEKSTFNNEWCKEIEIIVFIQTISAFKQI